MLQLLLETSTITDGNLAFKWGTHDDVLSNRATFLHKFGKTFADCVFMEVDHGETITHIHASDREKIITTEAFITKDVGVILFLLTGDCFPVVFYDPQKEVVGLAHLGWKPTDKRLAAKMVDEIKNVYGSEPKDIQVFIGPGIHKESYVFESPEQRSNPVWSEFCMTLPTGEVQVDLIGYIKKQVTENGVLEENIHISPIDTATSSDYFSHYRSLRTGEPEGRFATIAGLI